MNYQAKSFLRSIMSKQPIKLLISATYHILVPFASTVPSLFYLQMGPGGAQPNAKRFGFL